jgi:hypothetical protein
MAVIDTEYRLAAASQSVEKPGSLYLDVARIEAIRQDSDAATRLLANLFSDAEPAQPTGTSIHRPAVPFQDAPEAVARFGESHHAVLHSMLRRSDWTRSDLEGLFAQHDLMFDGALEQINEARIEVVGECLVTDDGELEVDRSVAAAMRSLLLAEGDD